jgi:hypothetical protein
LFDIRNRANRLVESLGFTDIAEAQVIINARNAENNQLSYKAYLERAEKLEIGLKEAKALVDKMQAREIDLEQENTTLRQEMAKRYVSVMFSSVYSLITSVTVPPIIVNFSKNTKTFRIDIVKQSRLTMMLGCAGRRTTKNGKTSNGGFSAPQKLPNTNSTISSLASTKGK